MVFVIHKQNGPCSLKKKIRFNILPSKVMDLVTDKGCASYLLLARQLNDMLAIKWSME